MSSSDLVQPRVLRIPRSDQPPSYVLVHVARSGAAVLDLKLVATEGENPYAVTSQLFQSFTILCRSHIPLTNARQCASPGSSNSAQKLITAVTMSGCKS